MDTSKRMITALAFVCGVSVATEGAQADTWYVDDGGDAANGCTSWADACPDPQTALVLADFGDEIRVAGGTYAPDGPGGDRLATFQLRDDVALMGGYAGFGAPDPNERDIELYETILTGDLNGDDDAGGDNSENSYHVTTGNGTNDTAILDGFTITAANADDVFPNGSGGGMFIDGGSPTVIHCAFSGNVADFGAGMVIGGSSSPMVTDCTFSGNMANVSGGGMYSWDTSDPTMTSCTFSANMANANGGGMFSGTGSSPTITNCTFSGNWADFGGGMLNRGGSSPTVTSCTFSGNVATGNGGGMHSWENSDPTVADCTFSGNSAIRGGGMFIRGISPTVSDCTFSGNEVTGTSSQFTGLGGGIYCINNSSPTITRCTFTQNTATAGSADQTGWGGAIYTVGVGTNPTIENCTFGGNEVVGDGFSTARGGAVTCAAGSSPMILGCSFDGNRAIAGSNADHTGIGGALNAFSGASPTIQNCTFNNNEAIGGPFHSTGIGGAVGFSVGSPTLTNCIFADNTATAGTSATTGFGGAFACGGTPVEGSVPTLTGCTFIGNAAIGVDEDFTGRGGAMWFGENTVPSLTNCMFLGNSANGGAAFGSGDGGAISCTRATTPTFTNCAFIGNTATGDGGAVHNRAGEFPSHTTLINCTISDNTAGGSGGGVFSTDEDSEHTTATVANCIVWGNGPDGIVDMFGAETTVTYSDTQERWPGVGNIDADPQFVDSDDYRLSPDSPCIDAADNAAVPADAPDLDEDGDPDEPIPFDLDGNPRFVNDSDTPDSGAGGCLPVDMGAYEYQEGLFACPCPADFDGDGAVGASDLAQLLGSWGPYEPCPPLAGADFDEDCEVSAADLAQLLGAWGACE